jgi:hypothetical protein
MAYDETTRIAIGEQGIAYNVDSTEIRSDQREILISLRTPERKDGDQVFLWPTPEALAQWVRFVLTNQEMSDYRDRFLKRLLQKG